MLEKSTEIKFGKIPGRSRKQAGNTPTNKGLVQKTRQGGVDAYRLPSGKIVTKGSAAYMGADTTYFNQTKKRDEWKAYKNRSNSEVTSDNATASSDAAKAADKKNKTESTDAVATPPTSSSNLNVPADTTPSKLKSVEENIRDTEAAVTAGAKKDAEKRANQADDPANRDKNPNATTYPVADKKDPPIIKKSSEKGDKPMSREQKQNQSQGAGGGAKSNVDKIGSSTEDDEFKTGAKKVQPLSEAELKDRRASAAENKSSTEEESSETKPTAKSDPYGDAKKKDANLDSYIKTRNNSKKGSPEHTKAQNAINAAYEKGPQREVKQETKSIPIKAPTSIKRDAPDKSLAVKQQNKPVTSPLSKKSSSNTGGGSGMGLKNKADNLKNELKSTAQNLNIGKSNKDTRIANRSKRKAGRVANRADRKSTRNQIREIKGKPARASYGLPRKQAQFGLGAIKGAISGFKEGGIGGALKGGVKGGLGLGQGGILNKAAGALGIGGGGGGGGAAPAAGAAPAVDPNAVPQAKKGKVVDRRKKRKGRK